MWLVHSHSWCSAWSGPAPKIFLSLSYPCHPPWTDLNRSKSRDKQLQIRSCCCYDRSTRTGRVQATDWLGEWWYHGTERQVLTLVLRIAQYCIKIIWVRSYLAKLNHYWQANSCHMLHIFHFTCDHQSTQASKRRYKPLKIPENRWNCYYAIWFEISQ